LGVVAAVFKSEEFGELIQVPIPTEHKSGVRFAEMLDLGVVFRAQCVVETIELWLKQHAI
jgi:hypothetical protein